VSCLAKRQRIRVHGLIWIIQEFAKCPTGEPNLRLVRKRELSQLRRFGSMSDFSVQSELYPPSARVEGEVPAFGEGFRPTNGGGEWASISRGAGGAQEKTHGGHSILG
jgi:hypothetical protein